MQCLFFSCLAVKAKSSCRFTSDANSSCKLHSYSNKWLLFDYYYLFYASVAFTFLITVGVTTLKLLKETYG